MSPSIKLGLLSLVSAAAAVPHSGGGHSRFHSSKATGGGGYGTGTGSGALPAPYPTGGWGGSHNHTHTGPSAAGAGNNQPVTTIIDTLHSTETVVSTIYAKRPGGGNGGPNSVGAAGASSGGAAGACGPATVYVTATNKVTVTVPAGGAPASSAAVSPVGGPSDVPAGPASSKVHSSKAHSSKAEQPAPTVGGGYGTSAPAQPAASSSAVEKELPPFSVNNPKKEATKEASKPATSAAPHTPPAASPSKPASSAAASSAAQPSPSGGSGGGYSGKKRGLAYTSAGDLSKFGGSKFGFAYNWNPQPNGDMPSGVEFIPTVHPLTGAWATPENYQDLIKKQTGAKTLFTFNEPDQPEQANIAADQFCTQWDKWITPITNANPGLTVVAPSVSNGNQSMSAQDQRAPVGLYYLELVKQKCPKAAAAWKEINIHFYDNYDSNTLSRFKAHYENAAKLNPGKNIWVTELNVNDGYDNSAPQFLKEVTSYLDSQSNCAGYSWFKVGSQSSRELLKGDGSLSECGKAYAS